MIDFRYHLVSIVAVFLALTVGIVLGTTMLQDPLLNTLQSETSDLREESEELRGEKDVVDRYSAGGDQLAAAFSDDILADRLAGVRVVVLESPGVDEELRNGVVARIEQAGGTVPGRVAFTEKYIDPDQATFVNELTDQLAAGADLPRGGAHERAGAELARAVIDPGTGGEDPAAEDATGFDASAVLAGFTEAGLVAVQGDPAEQGDIGVVLAPGTVFATTGGSPEPQDGTDSPGNDAMLALTRALHDAVGGAVLVGDTGALGAGGILAEARAAEEPFSTVDSAGRTAGDVATVLAVAAATESRAGDYGIGEGVDGFLPDPLPGVRESGADPQDRRSPPHGDGAEDGGDGSGADPAGDDAGVGPADRPVRDVETGKG
ncbi:copper transporter [Nocardiopsis trehalosi]|uniref:copper transporter n=1 Tax=Nocardiopsis trehalosi TaxID=109329 RepID=UPI0009FC5148|nr:copper transporter [Nocardiopsis trehalosi]